MRLFDCTNSVFNITDENNRFSINIPGHWNSELAEETIDRLNILLERRSENDIELHVEAVKNMGNRIVLEGEDYKLSDLNTQKDEILEKLKKSIYQSFDDMVFRLQLTYDEIVNPLDFKFIPTKRIGYSLKPDIYQIGDLNNTLKNFLPDIVKVSVTIDEKN